MSYSFGGALLDRLGGANVVAVLLVASVQIGGCNSYTPDMLLASSAGGASTASSSGGGAGGTAHVVTEGGHEGEGTTAPKDSETEASPQQGGSSDASGNTSTEHAGGTESASADAGGFGKRGLHRGGADAGDAVAGGAGAGGAGAEGVGGAGSSDTAILAGAGGTTSGGAAGAGGAMTSTCWLDRMREQSAPITLCDTDETSYWYTFLPSGIAASKAMLEPSPSNAFEREPLSTDEADEEIRAATGAAFKATMRGQISSVVDHDAGIGFKLSSGAPFSVRGATLNFYYRAQYSSPNRVLRVTVPCDATEWRPEGTCTINCGNHYGYELPNTNGKWALRSVRLDTIANGGSLKQLEGWGPYPWNGDAALAVEFDVRKYAERFEVSVGPIWLTWPNSEGGL